MITEHDIEAFMEEKFPSEATVQIDKLRDFIADILVQRDLTESEIQYMIDVLDNTIDMLDPPPHYPIQDTAVWQWMDKVLKPVMCDPDETLFAKLTTWQFHDLSCVCCGYWRGVTVGVFLTTVLGLIPYFLMR